ncbi:NAD(P)H-dependent glycerol-3-phosphate dehydrogenase [Elioraea sp.]|uniref:NAD(P)H-dependent glycerol-3-phosphate dehydrogenase n=1 Tax=Elioraea sp. TaxID=2185103 RepID=UPI0021DD031B|nr:NAD(P)H-dependent glycerol-3-phosphate dehydrogenase [Elioraea sp.]GIX10517.1 MAG: glycerol-3-phosphate dehydrogenase [NAD(P)+] [Elioraea sp.]
MTERVAVIGAGAWGTALALRIAAIRPAVLWARTVERAQAIAAARENARYLPGHRLPETLAVTADAAALRDATAVLLAVPAQALRMIAAVLRPHWPDGIPAVVCAKGIERGTLRLPAEILAETLPAAPPAVLTGPTFAHELAAGLPAAAVLAAADEAARARLLALLAMPRFRLYGSADLIGTQLGGAAKNVIAIAAGVVEGMGLGENARAALITRGVAELARLVAAEGGRPETAAGLSGLGDLILTCTGAASRNHALGVALGRGATLEEALAARVGVTEGVHTAPALVARAARTGTELPIAAAVADLLAGRATPAMLVEGLLSRGATEEWRLRM